MPTYERQNDSFTETQGLLGGTFRRLNDMSKKQGGRWLYCESVRAVAA